MNETNIENNNEDNEQQEQQQEQQQAQQQGEQAGQAGQEQQQAAADNDDGRTRRRLRLISVLENEDEFSFQTRNKTDELVEYFLQELGNDIHDMLCDTDFNSDNYRGLDCDRDTEKEVETTIRFFPEVLSRQKEIVWFGDDDEDDEENVEDSIYPIQLLAPALHNGGQCICNLKAASFIPLVARLAIEFNCFDEEFRGGLLCEDFIGGNVLNNLMLSDPANRNNREHLEHTDDTYLLVLLKLRKIGLLKKEDIQRYELLKQLANLNYFADKRFRFLVEWDPNALIQTSEDGWVPLYYSSTHIQGFQLVFEYGIRYFPKKKGIHLLFRKNDNCDDWTPFNLACFNYGHEHVMEVVEDTLARYYTSSDSTPPLNIEEALITAAIDENIHIDGVYFLIRRQPDILQKLLSSSSSSSSMTGGNENNNDNNDDKNDKLEKTKTNSKRRKRKEKMKDDDY
jgi:hypothetical protein